MRRIPLTFFVVICMTTFVIGLPCHGTYRGGGGTAPIYYSAPAGGGFPSGGVPSGGGGFPSGGAPSGGGSGVMGAMTGMAENFMQSARLMMGKK